MRSIRLWALFWALALVWAMLGAPLFLHEWQALPGQALQSWRLLPGRMAQLFALWLPAGA